MGIYTYYTEGFEISNNTILHNSAYTSRYGIYVYYNEGASRIFGNKVLFDKFKINYFIDKKK